ncbi:MAG: hypothetical protein WKH64_08140 [Chloroflexia bacterium]
MRPHSVSGFRYVRGDQRRRDAHPPVVLALTTKRLTARLQVVNGVQRFLLDMEHRERACAIPRPRGTIRLFERSTSRIPENFPALDLLVDGGWQVQVPCRRGIPAFDERHEYVPWCRFIAPRA